MDKNKEKTVFEVYLREVEVYLDQIKNNNQSPQEKSSQKLVRSSQTIISDNERRRPPKRAPKIQLRPHWIKYWRPFPNLFDEFYVIPKRTYKETGIRRPKQRKKLMGKIRDKSMVSQAVSYITTEHNEKQQYYQHKMVENDKEYRKFLNEIQQKVDDRPLLIDQHDERVVKEKALRRYQDILNRNGLSPDFVIRKVKTNRESDVSRYTYDPDLGMKKKKTLTRKRWDDEKTCDELKPYNPVEMKLNMMLTKIQPDVTVDDEIKKQKTINRISTSKKQFLKKHKHFGIAIKPCWVTYWQQTPQPRLYDYVTLQKRWFDW